MTAFALASLRSASRSACRRLRGARWPDPIQAAVDGLASRRYQTSVSRSICGPRPNDWCPPFRSVLFLLLATAELGEKSAKDSVIHRLH